MTDHEIIKARFLDFLFTQIEELHQQGMHKKQAAELVMDTAFLTLQNTWVDAYGTRQMAEEFYQVADGLVARSMEDSK
jgi:prophage DNA circulation protein